MWIRSGRRRWAVIAAAALIGALAAGCGLFGNAAPLTAPPAAGIAMEAAMVRTATGTVRGVVGADYRRFDGIPYAAAPVGALRFAEPLPAPGWPGVRAAERPGPWCVQEVGPGSPDTLTSEDCLTLNVWTPTGQTSERRPVMVWVHGGGFVKGSGDVYDARRLAARGGIVVVTINYRLGALGFLADPALGDVGAVGNYGLADQQAALRWVRDNIANFGGDPEKVTIAGESAGAMSVCDHLVAPGSAGLFRAAIIQSGPCQAQVDLATAQQISRDYAASLGCTEPAAVAACLGALPAAVLARPLWYARFGTDQLGGPVTGTPVLPTDPVRALLRGAAPGTARVPVLIGTNRDEFTLFVALRYLREGRELDATEYFGALADTFGAFDAPAVLAHYPLERYGGSVSLAYSAAATDGVFACLADRLAGGLARSEPAVYAYEFDDPHAPAPRVFDRVPFGIAASHSLELRYLFDIRGVPALDPAQRRLADQMIDYWSAFVITGAPKAPGQPDWPAVGTGADGDRWMSLRTDGSRVVDDFSVDHQCEFWANVSR